MATPTLNQILTYPVKGVPHGIPHSDVAVQINQRLPSDRQWAFRIGEANCNWARKNNFLQAMSYPKMALIAIEEFLKDKGCITLSNSYVTLKDEGDWVFDTKDSTACQQKVMAFARHVGYTGESSVHLVHTTDDKAFTDKSEPYISIGNLNTVRAIAAQFGYWGDDEYKNNDAGLQLGRFSINLWLEGLPAFEELKWIGKTLQISSVQLRIDAPITRCPKINANTETGERDINLLQDLTDWFRTHPNLPENVPKKPILGMFGTIIQGGELQEGADAIIL